MSYISESQTILNINLLQNQLHAIQGILDGFQTGKDALLLETNANETLLDGLDTTVNRQLLILHGVNLGVDTYKSRPSQIVNATSSFISYSVGQDLSVPYSGIPATPSIFVQSVSKSTTTTEMLIYCNFQIECVGITGDLFFILQDLNGVQNYTVTTINTPGTLKDTIQMTWVTSHLRGNSIQPMFDIAMDNTTVDGSVTISNVTWAVFEILP